MLPHTHFLFGLLLAILGYWGGQFDKASAIILAIASVAIDVDHPIAYFIHHGKLRLKNAWNNAAKQREHERTFIHTPVGIVIISAILLLLMRFDIIAYVLFLAYFSHMLLDYLYNKTYKPNKFVKILNIEIPIFFPEIVLDMFLIAANIIAFYFAF